MTTTPEQAVIQADRNMAIRLLEAGGQDWQAKEIRLGQGDHFPIVQAFAEHRLAHSQPASEGLRVCSVCGGTGERPVLRGDGIYDYVPCDHPNIADQPTPSRLLDDTNASLGTARNAGEF